jgi:hypothetical protein
VRPETRPVRPETRPVRPETRPEREGWGGNRRAIR